MDEINFLISSLSLSLTFSYFSLNLFIAIPITSSLIGSLTLSEIITFGVFMCVRTFVKESYNRSTSTYSDGDNDSIIKLFIDSYSLYFSDSLSISSSIKYFNFSCSSFNSLIVYVSNNLILLSIYFDADKSLSICFFSRLSKTLKNCSLLPVLRKPHQVF